MTAASRRVDHASWRSHASRRRRPSSARQWSCSSALRLKGESDVSYSMGLECAICGDRSYACSCLENLIADESQTKLRPDQVTMAQFEAHPRIVMRLAQSMPIEVLGEDGEVAAVLSRPRD